MFYFLAALVLVVSYVRHEVLWTLAMHRYMRPRIIRHLAKGPSRARALALHTAPKYYDTLMTLLVIMEKEGQIVLTHNFPGTRWCPCRRMRRCCRPSAM